MPVALVYSNQMATIAHLDHQTHLDHTTACACGYASTSTPNKEVLIIHVQPTIGGWSIVRLYFSRINMGCYGVHVLLLLLVSGAWAASNPCDDSAISKLPFW